MKHSLYRSSRHELLAAEYPTEPAVWARPSVRSILATEPVCDCGKGQQGRVPCPTPAACMLAEPEAPKESSRLDREGAALLRWLIAVPVLVLVVGLVAALWP